MKIVKNTKIWFKSNWNILWDLRQVLLRYNRHKKLALSYQSKTQTANTTIDKWIIQGCHNLSFSSESPKLQKFIILGFSKLQTLTREAKWRKSLMVQISIKNKFRNRIFRSKTFRFQCSHLFNTRVYESFTQTIFKKRLIKFWLVNKLTTTLYKGENRSPKLGVKGKFSYTLPPPLLLITTIAIHLVEQKARTEQQLKVWPN